MPSFFSPVSSTITNKNFKAEESIQLRNHSLRSCDLWPWHLQWYKVKFYRHDLGSCSWEVFLSLFFSLVWHFQSTYTDNLLIFGYIRVLLLLLLSRFSRVQLCVTPWRQPTRLPCPWNSPGKNTGVGCHFLLQCMKVKSESEVTQLCLTLSDSMDCSLPGSSVHGIFQARVLEWIAISFSRGSSRPRNRTWVSHIVGRRFTVWATREAPTFMKAVH